jgi:hypothetical protein
LPNCPPPPPPPSVIQGAADVAFGDSYISGEGAPAFDTSPVTAPTAATNPACHVALTAWPALIFNFPVTLNQIPYQNWACSGSTIAQVQSQIVAAVKAGANAGTGPAQGLGKDTSSVQLSAGGNNLGFGDDLICAVAVAAAAGLVTLPTGCIPSSADMRSIANNVMPQLVSLYQQLAQAAPNAVIEVAAYPIIFPTDSRRCCSTH